MYKIKRFIGVRKNNKALSKEFLDNYEISFHIEVQ